MVKKKSAKNKPVMTVKPLRALLGEVIPDGITQDIQIQPIEDKKVTQPSVSDDSEVVPTPRPSGHSEERNHMQDLLDVLNLQAERQDKVEHEVSELTKTLRTVNNNIAQAMDTSFQRKDTVQEEKPKGLDLMGGVKMITDIMNGPIGNLITKAIEGLGGGGEEAAASQTPVMSAEEIKKYQELAAYRDGRMRRMDEMQESWMGEMVKALKLKNDLSTKELSSDLT